MPTTNETHLEPNPLAEATFADDLEEELKRSFEQAECKPYVELPAAELGDWGDLELDLTLDEFSA